MRVAKDLGVGRVRDLAVERHHVAARVAQRLQGVAVRAPGRDLLAELPGRQLQRPAHLEAVRLAFDLGLRHVHDDVPLAAELCDRLLGVVERLAVPARLVLDRLDALALDRARDDHRRHALHRGGLAVGALDRADVVAVDLDRVPAERLRPVRVRVEVPAVHRLAALAELVHVDDRGQVVEPVEGGVLERLPHRALGHLAVAAEHPDAVRQLVELLAGERDPDRERQALAERPGRDVDPRDLRRRVALQPAAEVAEGEQLLVRDRAGRLVHRVQQGRGVSLGEDEVVVPRVVRVVEVVVQVLRQQDGHQVGRRHRRGRVAGLGHGRRADRVHAQLLPQFLPALGVGHAGNVTVL